jgi:hypothetical protein
VGPVLFPVIILAVTAFVLVGIYLATRRTTAAGEFAPGEDEAARLRTEEEFAEAEAYQEQWREEQHREHPPEELY